MRTVRLHQALKHMSLADIDKYVRNNVVRIVDKAGKKYVQFMVPAK